MQYSKKKTASEAVQGAEDQLNKIKRVKKKTKQ